MEEFRDKRTAIIFDLADRKLMEAALLEEYRIFTYVHPLKIPVGIGFSLPIAKEIFAADRWRNLVAAAFEILKPAKEPLLHAGLRLMESLDENS